MTPRPRSPHMNNEEPINLSHYPDGRAPDIENGDNGQNGENMEVVDGETEKTEKPKRRRKLPIERDDFPAPPFPYSSSKRGMISLESDSYFFTLKAKNIHSRVIRKYKEIN